MHATPLVGRTSELEALGRGLDAAGRGQGAAFLVTGEPGIGKTRLCDEIGRAAGERGFAVAWGRCWEAGGAPPFWPWREVLRALDLPDDLLGAAPAPVDSEAGTFATLDAVRAALREASARRPLLLVLDDVHAADRASLVLLQFMARGLRGTRLALVATARDAEARRSSNADVLARVGRESTPLVLGRLADGDAAELAARISGRPAADAQVRRAVEVAEGNPLFLDESLHLLAGGAAGLPAGIRDVIRGRLIHLPDAARDVLAAASTLGREIDVSLLTGLAGHDPRAALETAREAGLLVDWEGGRLAFSHQLVRDVLHADLPAQKRAALHARLSQLLEQRGDTALVERAHHALQGVAAIPALEAADLARRAAAVAATSLAFDRAGELLAAAADVLDRAGAEAGLRCDVRIELAQARFGCGDSAAGLAACRTALELARTLRDPVRLCLAALALGSEIRPGIVDPELVAALEEAAAALGDRDLRLRARVLARLAGARQPAPDPMEPMALAREAIAMARATGDAPTLLRTLHDGMAALFEIGEPEERARLDRELAELALELDERVLAARGLTRLVIDLLELCDLPGAERELARLDRLAAELRHPRYAWRPAALRAMVALLCGDLDRALALDARAEELAALAGSSEPRLALALHRGLVAFHRERWGDLDAVRPELEAMTRFFPEATYSLLIWTAVVEFARGQPEAARRALRDIDRDLVARAEPMAIHPAVPAICALGDRAMQEWALGVLEPHQDRVLTSGLIGMLWEGPICEAVGRLCHALGRDAEARSQLERALRLVRSMPSPPAIARVLEGLAPVLERAGLRERAAAARAEAAEIRQHLGAPAALGAIHLEQEGEVWTLRAGPRTLRLKDSRGLQLLARLLAEPGRELHVLELSGAAPEAEGDAGELLDARAIAAYRARLRELREDLEEAEGNADSSRAERARAEIEALQAELARGVGLAGRPRRAGDAAERARVNVQRRLRDAIRRVTEVDGQLGEHLEKTVITGTYCSYRPPGAAG